MRIVSLWWVGRVGYIPVDLVKQLIQVHVMSPAMYERTASAAELEIKAAQGYGPHTQRAAPTPDLPTHVGYTWACGISVRKVGCGRVICQLWRWWYANVDVHSGRWHRPSPNTDAQQTRTTSTTSAPTHQVSTAGGRDACA